MIKATLTEDAVIWTSITNLLAEMDGDEHISDNMRNDIRYLIVDGAVKAAIPPRFTLRWELGDIEHGLQMGDFAQKLVDNNLRVVIHYQEKAVVKAPPPLFDHIVEHHTFYLEQM